MTARIPASWRAELETCYMRCARDVNRHVFFLTRGDRELTEDVAQEAFRAAAGNWEQLRSFSETRQVAWLCRTATHIAVDHFRRNETARRKQAEVLRLHYQRPAADTLHEALTEVTLEHCWKVIERMPPQQHLVALLRWRCGYQNREISRMLGMAEGTVSAHVSAARRTLRSEAGSYLPFGADDLEGGNSDD
ncbi:RNA polymerase sigma factor [Streptomyces sp. V4I2]|uniref:RNA polymerase sigma factor n=1 Tax=Streptomyces sp. V4I2 TaxID=3042280 RepID=UPI002782A5DB|nr:sigma-70 family RNA polymerase sigma factor [Streptomyces sp. V4I2]MDQ1041840.1 RNA polymerase sigma-70 factor (ECF subfamily) [Streptomyces sp. V4I2]